MLVPTRLARLIGTDSNALQREFDAVLNGFFNPEPATGVLAYGVDVREDANHFYLDAELPGFKKENVEITLEDQALTISAERKVEAAKDGDVKAESLLQERRYGKYTRSFKLPPTVDSQKVEAHLVDGVLSITLNKREETKPRKIVVS